MNRDFHTFPILLLLKTNGIFQKRKSHFAKMPHRFLRNFDNDFQVDRIYEILINAAILITLLSVLIANCTANFGTNPSWT
ncbi:hypothetical protein BWD12_17005 [Leptospira santarosai serovar Bananal]|nr:hypothetical protein BWD11_13935 [Leptospira santarosai serovar Grippotyphosa]ONF77053.1 hypothetical protein BWD12_17005 [Leptospira santarosai serovar Bananal]